MYILTAAEPINKAKILLAQPYINNEPQSESPSGRHNRVDQLGTSTATSKAKASLAQLYINSDQQSKPPQAQPRPRVFSKAIILLAQPYGEKEQQAKALPDDTAMLTRRRDQQSKSIYFQLLPCGISTTTSRAKAHLEQQAMMDVFFLAKRKYGWHSRILTKRVKSKALPNGTDVSA